MLLAEARSAMCVQRLDDSRNSAIHTTYRISLRSSSLREPRYPLLRVVLVRRVRRPGRAHSLLQIRLVGCGCLKKGANAGQPSLMKGLIGTRLGGLGFKAVATHPARRNEAPGGRPTFIHSRVWLLIDSMILPQVHLRKPCYDFSFL